MTPRLGESDRKPMVSTMREASQISCSARKRILRGSPVLPDVNLIWLISAGNDSISSESKWTSGAPDSRGQRIDPSRQAAGWREQNLFLSFAESARRLSRGVFLIHSPNPENPSIVRKIHPSKLCEKDSFSQVLSIFRKVN